MSYVEKEKLIKADIASIENRVRHAFNQGYDLGFKDGKERVKSQEPRKGHWIDREVYDADRWKCSECGRTEQWKENFCPNCGADMREV